MDILEDSLQKNNAEDRLEESILSPTPSHLKLECIAFII